VLNIAQSHLVWGKVLTCSVISFLTIILTLLHSLSLEDYNYSATGNLYNSQITTTLVKPFPACCVFSRFLATASNSGDSSASRAQVLSSQTPVQN
jgi:hypothetical protein